MVRMGVLGAARVAALSTIAHARSRHDVMVVAVAARDPQRSLAFAAEHGVPDGGDSYDALLSRRDIDVVHVALPPQLHEIWTLRALAAGKAVLCEKPIATDAAAARRMTSAAAAAGLPLIEAFHYRFHPLMRQAVEMVRNGELGRILKAEAVFEANIPEAPEEFRWSPGPGGGALLDLGCYPIHALRTLLGGEPTVCRATREWRHGVDASTEAELAFPNGTTAQIRCSMIASRYRADLWLQGELAQLRLRNFVLPHAAGSLSWGDGARWREEPASPRSSFACQLDHLVAVLGGAAPLTGGEDAVRNMRALDAIARATSPPSKA